MASLVLVSWMMNWQRLEIFKMLLQSFFPLAVMIIAVLGSIVFGLATIGPAIVGSMAIGDVFVTASLLLVLGATLILGNIIADLLLAVADPHFGNRPVDVPLDVILGKTPKMVRDVTHVARALPALVTVVTVFVVIGTFYATGIV